MDDYKIARVLRCHSNKCNMCHYSPPDCEGECLEGCLFWLENLTENKAEIIKEKIGNDEKILRMLEVENGKNN